MMDSKSNSTVSICAAPSASAGFNSHLKLTTCRLRNSRTRYGLRVTSPVSRTEMMPQSILSFLQQTRNKSGEPLSMYLVIENFWGVACFIPDATFDVGAGLAPGAV